MKKLTAVATASLLASSSLLPVTASADDIFCRWHEGERMRSSSSTGFPNEQAFLAYLPKAYGGIIRELLNNPSIQSGAPLEGGGLCRITRDEKPMFNR